MPRYVLGRDFNPSKILNASDPPLLAGVTSTGISEFNCPVDAVEDGNLALLIIDDEDDGIF